MRTSLKKVLLPLISLFVFSNGFAQKDDVIELPDPVKNSLTVRPLNALMGMYGISYERYIAKGFSVLIYGGYDNMPFFQKNNINTWVRNSMEVNSVSFTLKGFSIIPEVRYYFKEKKEEFPLVGDKDMGSLTGWFVGVYVPYRNYDLQFDIVSEEQPSAFHGIQQDNGTFKTSLNSVGFGIEGGRHWVWGKFTLEIFTGISFNSGFPSKALFDFDRPLYGEYTKRKDLGLFHSYGTFTPRFGINLGIAF